MLERRLHSKNQTRGVYPGACLEIGAYDFRQARRLTQITANGVTGENRINATRIIGHPGQDVGKALVCR
jgi:hypothetical protein